MRPNANIIKTYWQTMDKDRTVNLFSSKPRLCINHYHKENMSDGFIEGAIFPIPLKPLQIATITVNENGTWAWEIEREEGWYMARWSDKIDTLTNSKSVFVRRENGKYVFPSSKELSDYDLEQLTISSTRIPDECII